MSDVAAEIAAAERRAAQARDRLSGSLHRLQAKLSPKVLARDAARSAADAGQSAATTSLDYARANPASVAGAAAAAGLFLFRKRIVRLFRRKPRPQPGSVPAQARPSRSAHSSKEAFDD